MLWWAVFHLGIKYFMENIVLAMLGSSFEQARSLLAGTE